ncbi:MAG: hypothetical protein JWN48_4528 [Myxococcaceae bacterium]|nr:hypothetical protein [Myxococcaceae bacterium]
MSEAFCSALSLEVGEPLAGTAAGDTDRYLVLEHDGSWGPKGVEDSGLPDATVSFLHALSQHHPRLRVQLTRRLEGRAEGAALRVYMAECGEQPALYTATLADLEQLPTLALDGWLRGASQAPGQREEQPLYLVCVHGKRDRCCALLGLPVHKALVALVGERALQTTHLGGHRFAATLLSLPDGVCYGRVQADEVPQLVAATERGELYDLARVRGRTAYSAEAQAAEVMLRERLGDLRISALSLRAVERLDAALAGPREPTRYRVRFEGESGIEHVVELTREPLAPMPQSCGAVPKPASRLVRAAAPE